MLNIESFSQRFELVRWNFEIITSNWLKDENNVGFGLFFFWFFSNGRNKLPYLSHILLSVFNSLKFLVIISKFDLTVSNIWENNMKFQVVMLEFWENIQKFGDYYLKISGYYHKFLDYGWEKIIIFLVTEKVSAECGFTFIMEACFCHWKVKNLDYYLKISTSWLKRRRK